MSISNINVDILCCFLLKESFDNEDGTVDIAIFC